MGKQYEKQIPVKLDSEQVAERSQEMASKALLAARVEIEIDKVKDEARAVEFMEEKGHLFFRTGERLFQR